MASSTPPPRPPPWSRASPPAYVYLRLAGGSVLAGRGHGGGGGETEAPVVPTRPCTDIGATRVTPDLPPGFPTLPGVAFTANDAKWSTQGYFKRSIRSAHDDYV